MGACLFRRGTKPLGSDFLFNLPGPVSGRDLLLELIDGLVLCLYLFATICNVSWVGSPLRMSLPETAALGVDFEV